MEVNWREWLMYERNREMDETDFSMIFEADGITQAVTDIEVGYWDNDLSIEDMAMDLI